jgi:hypothetical protein
MKKQFSILLCAGAMVAASGAFAFGLPAGLPGVGSSSTSGADLGAQQDSLVKGYAAANKDVLNGHALMEQALKISDDSVNAKATADALTDGATKDNLEAANKAVAASSDRVVAELAKAPKLDAEAKTTYARGLGSLATGVIKYVGVGKNVKDMGSSLKTASPMMLPKLSSAVYVVSKFPDSLQTVGKALKAAVDFAKNNDIPVPPDATSALSSL